jgi:splicing factor 3A subunit 3
VAEKLKQEGRQQMFQQETMEELEDDEGNVYNRKVGHFTLSSSSH